MKRKMIKLIGISLCTALIFSGCSKKTVTKEVNLNDVLTQITEKVNLPEDMMEISESELSILYNIEPGEVKQYAGMYATMSTLADEIIMLEPADGTSLDDLKEKVDTRYQTKLNEMRDYLPDEFDKIEKCSVYTEGEYVVLYVSDDADEMLSIFESALNK